MSANRSVRVTFGRPILGACALALCVQVARADVPAKLVGCFLNGREVPCGAAPQVSARAAPVPSVRLQPVAAPTDDHLIERQQAETRAMLAALRGNVVRITSAQAASISGTETTVRPAGSPIFGLGRAAADYDDAIMAVDRLLPDCAGHEDVCTGRTQIASESLRNAVSIGNAIRDAGGLNGLSLADQKFLTDQISLALAGAPLQVAIPAGVRAPQPTTAEIATATTVIRTNMQAGDAVLGAVQRRVRIEAEAVPLRNAVQEAQPCAMDYRCQLPPNYDADFKRLNTQVQPALTDALKTEKTSQSAAAAAAKPVRTTVRLLP
jgi:hypothetical protein